MPFWVAGAILGSSLLSSSASKSAANTQASGQEAAANVQQNMFDTINQQNQPFIQPGYAATTKLSDLLGTSGNTGTSGYGSLTQPFNPTQDQLNNYPGYQFALNTGAQATRNKDTPGVGALSGPALKDLTSFNVGMASQNYQNYFNNTQTQQNNIFDRLNKIATLGQNAATNVGTAGTALGTGIAQATAAAAGSQAAGTVGSANALSGSAVPLAYLMSGNNSSSLSGGGYDANMSSFNTQAGQPGA